MPKQSGILKLQIQIEFDRQIEAAECRAARFVKHRQHTFVLSELLTELNCPWCKTGGNLVLFT